MLTPMIPKTAKHDEDVIDNDTYDDVGDRLTMMTSMKRWE